MSIPSTGRLFRHVADIINLHPGEDPCCAGYATSQGRQCHQYIPASDSTAACRLLDRATEDLHVGRPIDHYLQDLASLVLCRTHRQAQAPGLIVTWGAQIQRFQTDLRALMDRIWLEDDLSTELRHTMDRTSQVVTQLHTQLSELSATAAGLRSLGAHATRVVIPASANLQRERERSLSTMAGHTGHPLESLAIRAGTTETQHLGIAAMPAPGRLGSTGSAGPSVIRGQLDGECSICLTPLGESEHSTNNGEGPSGNNGGNSRGGNQTKQFSAPKSPFQGHAQVLVWCKRRCGANFHKSCMDQWTKACQKDGRQAQCPMCRSSWNA